MGRVRVEQLEVEARLYFDPVPAVDDELTALAERKVVLRPGASAQTTELHVILDTLDAEAFRP